MCPYTVAAAVSVDASAGKKRPVPTGQQSRAVPIDLEDIPDEYLQMSREEVQ